MSAVRKWIPAHTRALTFSLNVSDRLSKFRVVPDLLLVTRNETWSVPKKYRSVRRTAPAAQLWPEGWSGNGGVTSAGGVATGVEGSKSGLHAGSACVAGLPSPSA